jgi:hypothetical protein
MRRGTLCTMSNSALPRDLLVSTLHRRQDVSDQEWRQLCEQASKETDPDELMRIIERLNEVLERRESQLRRRLSNKPDPVVE